MEVVINAAAEVFWTVEPGTGTDEDAAAEPLRTVVAVRSAAVRHCVVVTIWTYRSNADVNLDLSARGHSKRGQTGTKAG
jgi:hypothetical protein